MCEAETTSTKPTGAAGEERQPKTETVQEVLARREAQQTNGNTGGGGMAQLVRGWFGMLVNFVAIYILLSTVLGGKGGLFGSQQEAVDSISNRTTGAGKAAHGSASPVQGCSVAAGVPLQLRLLLTESPHFRFERHFSDCLDDAMLRQGQGHDAEAVARCLTAGAAGGVLAAWSMGGIRYGEPMAEGDVARQEDGAWLNMTVPPALLQYEQVALALAAEEAVAAAAAGRKQTPAAAAAALAARPNVYAHVFLSTPDAWAALVDRHYYDAIEEHGAPTTTSNTTVALPPQYNSRHVLHRCFPLVRYRRRKPSPKLVKLGATGVGAGADSGDSGNEGGPELLPVMPYWKPSLRLALVAGLPQRMQSRAMPPTILQHLQFLRNDPSDRSGGVLLASAETGSHYQPLLYQNDFWLTSKHLIEYEQLSFWAWSMLVSLEDQWAKGGITGSVTASLAAATADRGDGNGTVNAASTNATNMLHELLDSANAMSASTSERESDLIREILADTNPLLLGVTMVVTLLHTVFDVLAFKNDIQFWRKRKSMHGMSARTLVINCFFHAVIFLYLLDSSDKTSYMVIASNGVGLAIEVWKLHRAFHFRLVWGAGPLPQLTWHLEHGALDGAADGAVTDGEAGAGSVSETEEHDAVATTHLLYIAVPLSLGYSAYSYQHVLHRSYYSWAVSSLVGFVYAFGFILMTPQIYINYRLKSVAHMPWKAMVYKSLNTFIDDLFAFVIKMPTLHRISCLRDDVIFFIYLYQRWIYPVDYSRVNEFGQEAAPGEGHEQHVLADGAGTGAVEGDATSEQQIRPPPAAVPS